MATVLRCKVFSVLRTASRACIFLKPQSFTNVRSCATKLSPNSLKNMTVHQCLLVVENRISSKGKLSSAELDFIVQAVENKEHLRSNQALLLIRCCGIVAAVEKPEVRVEYANKVWNILKSSDVALDISHYNAFLKVQIENEQPVVWYEYLKTIEDQDLVANRVTFQYFLTHYCLKGDLAGATEVLEEMKRRKLFLNENIFNSLILGHCINNDINGAEGILNLMKEKGILVSANTYLNILCGLAMSGNIEKMRSVMKECSEKKIELRGSKLMDVIYYLFINGHSKFAEEMLRDAKGKNHSAQDKVTLQYRLLHKKRFEDYLTTMEILYGKEDYLERLRLAFRYIGNKEDFDTILKFKEECDKKGFHNNVMQNILYYVLMSNNVDKALKVIDHLHKSGEPVKEAYFSPLLVKLSQASDTNGILRIIHLMTCDYNLTLSTDFIARNIFDSFHGSEKMLLYLVSGLSMRLPVGLVYNALLSSSLDKNDKVRINFFARRYRSLGALTDTTIISITKYLVRGKNTEMVYDILKKWIHIQNRVVNEESSGTDNLIADEKLQKINENLFQLIIDKLAIKILYYGERSVIEDFLNFAKTENVPISSNVLDFITQKLDAQLSGAEINNEEVKAVEKEIFLRFKNSKKPVELQFVEVTKSGSLDEIVKYFEENKEIHSPFTYRKLIEALKSFNADDLIEVYVKKYYEKFSQVVELLPLNLNVETEMIKRGMLKEAIELIDKREITRNPLILADVLENVFKNATEDKIKDFLNAINSSSKKILNVQNVINGLAIRGMEESVLKLLNVMSPPELTDVDLNSSLLPALCNNGKTELIEKFIKFLEEKSDVKSFRSEILFMCACTGDIERGRAVLSSESNLPLRWMTEMHRINQSKCIEVLENAIAILKGYEDIRKRKLYNFLMAKYEIQSQSPEKALDLWVQLQEENIPPTPNFLDSLAKILKKHGQEVPFEVPSSEGLEAKASVQIPKSFPSSLRECVSRYNDSKELRVLTGGLTNGLLKNELTRRHLEDLLKLNKSYFGSKHKNALLSLFELFNWKEKYEMGSLNDYAKEFANRNPEGLIQRLPIQFIAHLLGLKSKRSKKVMHIILWAHCQNKPEYEELFKILESKVDVLLNEKILKYTLDELEQNKDNPDFKSILSFLLSRNVFDCDEYLKRRAERILNPTEDVSESSEIELNQDLTSHENDFSFTNVMEDESDAKNKEAALDPEKHEEIVESPDFVKAKNTTSGSSSNI